MSSLPDFSSQGYQIIRELGHNLDGGRVAYLAIDLRSQQSVVLKQFQFARTANWQGFKAYEREIQLLTQLNHPGIPSYLTSFETADGFCMVQEYKDAKSLAERNLWNPDDIKHIAISLLEILQYLQEGFLQPVIHRDIKPENILIDDQKRVYLIDFGFARVGGGSVAMSSMGLGTIGFMAPEQLYNRELTTATDLYGLGATLICLLTNIRSTQMGELINDDDGRITFKPRVPKLSFRFIEWLEKMVQPKAKDRYSNASDALAALKPLYVIRLPELKLSATTVEFNATALNQKLSQTITASNSIPETVLEGTWEVAPHPSDPPHTPDTHDWITFHPKQFSSNQQTCTITVDTSKLIAQSKFERTILLKTNAKQDTTTIKLNAKTAPLPITQTRISLLINIALIIILITTTGISTWCATKTYQIDKLLMFSILTGSSMGLISSFLFLRKRIIYDINSRFKLLNLCSSSISLVASGLFASLLWYLFFYYGAPFGYEILMNFVLLLYAFLFSITFSEDKFIDSFLQSTKSTVYSLRKASRGWKLVMIIVLLMSGYFSLILLPLVMLACTSIVISNISSSHWRIFYLNLLVLLGILGLFFYNFNKFWLFLAENYHIRAIGINDGFVPFLSLATGFSPFVVITIILISFKFLKGSYNLSFLISSICLAIGFSAIFTFASSFNSWSFLTIASSVITGLLLAGALALPPVKLYRQIATYRASEQNLIKS